MFLKIQASCKNRSKNKENIDEYISGKLAGIHGCFFLNKTNLRKLYNNKYCFLLDLELANHGWWSGVSILGKGSLSVASTEAEDEIRKGFASIFDKCVREDLLSFQFISKYIYKNE